MSYYHVCIDRKNSKWRDAEVKLDLSKADLRSQILDPYEKGIPLVLNGSVIETKDIQRLRITESDNDSKSLISEIKYEDQHSSVSIIGGPSYEWQAARRGKDVTDTYIKTPPGTNSTSSSISSKKTGRKVFIVHGHDRTMKSEAEAFCYAMGLEPIILHRQPDKGLTLLEKFEANSDVCYALILISPDDIAFPADKAKTPKKDRGDEKRARQNVIFEWGYFAAKLGRSHVCCIYKDDVTLPSDLKGFVYKPIRESIDEIRLSLIDEIKAAGITLTV